MGNLFGKKKTQEKPESVKHDLRNNLNGIKGAIGLLHLKYADSYFDLIKSEIRDMEKNIDKMQ